jgi:hypothetical protein
MEWKGWKNNLEKMAECLKKGSKIKGHFREVAKANALAQVFSEVR